MYTEFELKRPAKRPCYDTAPGPPPPLASIPSPTSQTVSPPLRQAQWLDHTSAPSSQRCEQGDPADDDWKRSEAFQSYHQQQRSDGVEASTASTSALAGVNVADVDSTKRKDGKPPLPRGSACVVCRKRKLRCDGQRPKCATCFRLGHACGYGAQEGSVERLSEYAAILEDKIRTLEIELSKRQNHPEDAAQPYSITPPSPSNLFTAEGSTVPPRSGVLPGPDGVSALFSASWTELRSELKPATFSAAGDVIPIWGTDLPPSNIVRELMDLFFTTHAVILPMIHRARFTLSLVHGAIRTKPSLALVYSMLAIAAPYHPENTVRDTATGYYQLARRNLDSASSSIAGALGLGSWTSHGSLGPTSIATVTVELVQACVVLACIESGASDHQRAYMTVGTAARLAAMLGLFRMDETKICDSQNQARVGVLSQPALHPLPADPLLVEECRRTMWCVYVLDRFGSAACGWPLAIHEQDMRLLLPCLEDEFEQGKVGPNSNASFWPIGAPDKDDLAGRHGIARATQGPERLSPFAWTCRICLLGSRVSLFNYRPMGAPHGGPLQPAHTGQTLSLPQQEVEKIEQACRWVSRSVARDAGMTHTGSIPTPPDSTDEGINDTCITPPRPHLPTIMCQLIAHIVELTLHHLRLGPDLSGNDRNADPATSIKRCVESTSSIFELASSLLRYDDMTTRLWNSKVTPFSILPSYCLFCWSFPVRFLIQGWEHLSMAKYKYPELASVLNVSDLDKLRIIDSILELMIRSAERWPVALRFYELNRQGKDELFANLSSASTQLPSAPPPLPPPPPPPTTMTMSREVQSTSPHTLTTSGLPGSTSLMTPGHGHGRVLGHAEDETLQSPVWTSYI